MPPTPCEVFRLLGTLEVLRGLKVGLDCCDYPRWTNTYSLALHIPLEGSSPGLTKIRFWVVRSRQRVHTDLRAFEKEGIIVSAIRKIWGENRLQSTVIPLPFSIGGFSMAPAVAYWHLLSALMQIPRVSPLQRQRLSGQRPCPWQFRFKGWLHKPREEHKA